MGKRKFKNQTHLHEKNICKNVKQENTMTAFQFDHLGETGFRRRPFKSSFFKTGFKKERPNVVK